MGGGGPLQANLLDKTYEQIRQSYDAANGGFGGAPLFPRPVVPDFLLRYWSRTGKKEALFFDAAEMQAAGTPPGELKFPDSCHCTDRLI